MKTLGAALLALLLVQETPEGLIRVLTAGDLAARRRAIEGLIRIGEPARPALEKARQSDDAELRIRVSEILKTLDLRKELQVFLGAPRTVDLIGEMTLKEAAAALEKASGHTIEADAWPDERFKLELRDLPYWDAVEAVCAASGKRTPRLTEKGIKLGGSRYVGKPHLEVGGMTVRIDAVERGRTFKLGARTESKLLAFTLALGWERSCTPVWAYWDVDSALDDQGVDHKEAIYRFAQSGSDGILHSADDPQPRNTMTYYLVTESPPTDKSKVMVELKGKLVVWLKASSDWVSFNIPEPSEDDAPDLTERVEVFGLDFRPKPGVTITMSEGGWYRFDGVDIRIVERYSTLAFGIDKEGRRYPGGGWIEHDKKDVISIGCRGVPDDTRIERMTLRIPKRVIQVEIPFAFKDIPVN